MDSKKSNLCVSVDLVKKADVLKLVDAVGPYVCMIKTHCDIIEDFDHVRESPSPSSHACTVVHMPHLLTVVAGALISLVDDSVNRDES